MDILTKVGAFLVAIAILIAVHEFGHFWVARRLGVKVLRFSLGFGRPLISWYRRGDETEYVIAAWPVGGYVKMVDEREEAVDPADLPRAFNRQPVWKRAAIVAAGPAANFLFAFVVYWLVFMVGQTGLRPELGEVPPDSPAAAAGLMPGDLIERVGGRETPTWSEVWIATLRGAFGGDDVSVRARDESGATRDYWLAGEQLVMLDPAQGFLPSVGLLAVRPPLAPVLGDLLPGQPALEAGLLSGDQVTAIDSQPVKTWDDLVEIVRAHPAENLGFRVERGADTLTLNVLPAALIDETGETIGRIGAGPRIPDDYLADQTVVVRLGPLAAAQAAGVRILDVSVLTVRMIARMLTGRASLDNLRSPIGIADAAGRTASVGLEPFIQFLALLSVSLGLLNLMPVPVLDGGHLVFFAIEGVIRRPLPDAVLEQGQMIGIVLLAGLMSLAFYIDVMRYLGD